jgi:hypothetical protein
VKIDDRIIAAFQAPMGLHGQNSWRIVEADDRQGLILLEEATLIGPVGAYAFYYDGVKEVACGARRSVCDGIGRRLGKST